MKIKEKDKKLKISMAEVRKSIRFPLPKQTGGRHKDRRDVPRQEMRHRLKKGDW